MLIEDGDIARHVYIEMTSRSFDPANGLEVGPVLIEHAWGYSVEVAGFTIWDSEDKRDRDAEGERGEAAALEYAEDRIREIAESLGELLDRSRGEL